MAPKEHSSQYVADTSQNHYPTRSDSKINTPLDSNLTAIKEGLAHILAPSDMPTLLDAKAKREGDSRTQSVFYNPIQQFNRDLTVLAIKAFGEDFLAEKKIKSESKPRGKKRKRMLVNAGSSQHLAVKASTLPGGLNDVDSSQVNREHDKTDDAQSTELDIYSADFESEYSKKLGSVSEFSPKEEIQSSRTEKTASFTILDALSATGLRALRYALEIPFVTLITANDLSPTAGASISANAKFNNLESKIKVTTENAMSHMYKFASQSSGVGSKKYDVIDLDPYGTAVPFLDAAMHAISEGGLLCVTCTDSGVWASCGYPEKTYALYGGTPIKGLHSHEGGLRLILHSIASAAARHGMAIEPLMSLSIDFYARVFVRVFQSPMEVKLLAGKTMLVYNCDSGCGAWTTQLIAANKSFVSKDGQTIHKHGLVQGPSASPLCSHCNTKTHMSGPMYAGPLHNPYFLRRILESLPSLDKDTYSTINRIEGMLSTALEEVLLNDNTGFESPDKDDVTRPGRLVPRLNPSKIETHPFYFISSALAKVLHCQAPSDAEIKGALRHAGYNVSRSHAKPSSIRTNAPWAFVWKVMVEWIRQKAPIRDGALKQDTAGWRLLQNASDTDETPQLVNGDSRNETAAGVEVDNIQDHAAPTKGPRIIFDAKLGRDADKKKLMRYQLNPRENWGPMSRAKVKSITKEQDSDVKDPCESQSRHSNP